jgi:hypothetical protein
MAQIIGFSSVQVAAPPLVAEVASLIEKETLALQCLKQGKKGIPACHA